MRALPLRRVRKRMRPKCNQHIYMSLAVKAWSGCAAFARGGIPGPFGFGTAFLIIIEP